jgi:uncharacterized protein (TIGR02145 family)
MIENIIFYTMKTILISRESNLWFKIYFVTLLCFLFLLSPSCMKDQLDQGFVPETDELLPSASHKKVKLTGKVRDVDKNWYITVKIGDQWWMAENLKTTKFNDKTSIPLVPDIETWGNLRTPGYCWYNNDITYKDLNGALYNNYTVQTGKLCPTGWHVPTDNEWKQLELYLGMSIDDIEGEGGDRGDMSGKLKSTFGWNENGNGTNETGFSAYPAGYRTVFDIDYGYECRFWTSTIAPEPYPTTTGLAWSRELRYDSSTIFRGRSLRIGGYSVRCIKD